MDKNGVSIEKFIKEYAPGLTEYCCVVIDDSGLIHECSENHLKTLTVMSGDDSILSKIPDGISPLFYLTDMLKCVIVDYENQIFSGTLSLEQRESLEKLEEAGLIKKNVINIKSKC